MPGPCSLPNGSKNEYAQMNEIVCAIHFHCDMQELDKDGKPVKHDYVTYRVWLMRRNRLRTGKTL